MQSFTSIYWRYGLTLIKLNHYFFLAQTLQTLTYLIMCGTETLEFSSNTLVIRPLHRILSMHWNAEEQRKLILSSGFRREQLLVPATLQSVGPTWLMSLVHAAFSWRDGARRTTENGGPSGGSTTILNSRWLKPWPAALSWEERRRCRICFRSATVLAAGTQLESAGLLTVLVAGVQLLDESAFDQRERSSLLLAKITATCFTHSQLALLEQLKMTFNWVLLPA